MNEAYVRLEFADGNTDNPISIVNAIISNWCYNNSQIDRLECIANTLLNYCLFKRKQLANDYLIGVPGEVE